MKSKAVVFVPAFNEEKKIKETVVSLKRAGFHVVVVDDGSKDRTSSEAIRAGAEVIKLGKNRGKGRALKEAIFGYNLQGFNFVAFADADLGKSAEEMKELLKVVEKGEADLAIAQFPPPRKKGGFGLVKNLARFIISRKGFIPKSPLSGQRVLKKEFLERLRFDDGFGFEVGMTLDVLSFGGRIREVPVNMVHRETERSIKGFSHRGRQFIHILKAVLRRKLGL
jgi:glycosyltransferase involved in cell wall biosynthesis